MLVKENHQLKDYNTFHIKVAADAFIELYSETEVIELCESYLKKHRFTVIGGGSNILFASDKVSSVIKVSIPGISIIDEDDDYAFITAGAGVIWNDFVEYALGRNLGGIENLVLIPGTTGAAPIQNIGAYGQELKDTFYSLNAVELENCERSLYTREECRFGYRSSIFKHELKNKCIITSITLKLKKNPRPDVSYSSVKALIEKSGLKTFSIHDVSRVIADIRRSKLPDPGQIGNAGSFFKNPEIDLSSFEYLKKIYPLIPGFKSSEGKMKIAAGWLIEQCGWKGKREGDTGCHKDQALVLVNYGNASGKEIIAFAQKIKNSVIEKFGITLEEEVNII